MRSAWASFRSAHSDAAIATSSAASMRSGRPRPIGSCSSSRGGCWSWARGTATLGARPLDLEARRAAEERQRQLLKPPGSLGRLEELAIWMAAVTGEPLPSVRPLVVVAAADHGVAAEGVSAYPQEVTGQMLAAFLGGGSAIAV